MTTYYLTLPENMEAYILLMLPDKTELLCTEDFKVVKVYQEDGEWKVRKGK